MYSTYSDDVVAVYLLEVDGVRIRGPFGQNERVGAFVESLLGNNEAST